MHNVASWIVVGALFGIHAEHHFDKLVITCEIDAPEKKQEILDFCRTHGVNVSEFDFHEVVAGG